MNAHFAAASVLALSVAAPAAAQPASAPASVEVRRDGEGRYRYLFELRATSGPVEVLADRRLLRFEIRAPGSRRAVRCRHPAAPRRADEDRVRTVGGSELPVWREWIDLRMYCWGRALRALDAGGTVAVSFGFDGRRATPSKWVARPAVAGDTRAAAAARTATVRIDGAPLAIEPAPPAAAVEPEPAILVSMASADAAGQRTSFRVTLRTSHRSARIYLRWDLLRFVVRGPLGEVTCAPERVEVVPIVDFYRTLRGRRGIASSVDSALACPEGTFDLEGIYEVTPAVDLIYDGARYDLEALTGTFTGPPVPVRIRRSLRGYFEQTPSPPPPVSGRPDARGVT